VYPCVCKYVYVYAYTGGQRLHLGWFDSEEQAASAYDAAAVRVFGPHTALNLPRQGYDGRHGGGGAGRPSGRVEGDIRVEGAAVTRPRGCWRCGPLTPEGNPKAAHACLVAEVEEDGISGWSQHKAFQCPHAKKHVGKQGQGGEGRGEVVESAEEIARIIRACSLVVGLHPDQATGCVCVCVCVCVCMSVCVYACAINIHAHTGVQGHSGLCTCASEAVRRGAVLYLPPTLQRPFPIVRQACEIICTSLPPSNPYSLSYPTPLLFSPSLSSSLPPSLPPSLPSSPLDPHGSSV